MSGILDNLQDKTVLISATEKEYMYPVMEALQKQGAHVIVSEFSAHDPLSLDVISQQVERLKPDALLIHNVTTSGSDCEDALCKLGKQLGGSVPIVLYDPRLAHENGVKLAGIKVLGPDSVLMETLYAVAAAVSGQGRSGPKARGQ